MGSIPVGVLVGKLWGFDPRGAGSGNVGMTNVARIGGGLPAGITFAGDLLKGLIPVLVAQRILAINAAGVVLVAFAAFAGAIASIFLAFRGGKGVATSVGIWLGLAPLPLAVALAVFVAILAITRIVSLSSLAAAMSLPPAVAAFGSPRPLILLAIVISALVVFRHWENIERLMRGEETRIGTKQTA